MREEKISNYGYGFQTKVIACLMTKRNFTSQIYDLLKVEYFGSNSIKFLIKTALTYFKDYKELPTLEVFKSELEGVEDELERQQIKKALRDAWGNINSTDLKYIQEQTIKFCQDQEIKAAILNSVEYLKRGEKERIKTELEEALRVGIDKHIGTDYVKDFDARYEEDARNPIATPWDEINILMKGGLSGGELGVWIASSGAGKSWLLANIGSAAMQSGSTVVHYTLELDESYTGLRYDCILSGYPIQTLKDHKEKVRKKIEKIEGKNIIKYFPTKSISIVGLEGHLNKMMTLGIKPDLVIIDYADLMSLKEYGNQDKWDALQSLYEDLRGMAGTLDLPIWTVSQSNREGASSRVIEADKTAGSFGKIFTADFVGSLSRKAQDKVSKTGRVHIIKNRFGPDGMTFPATIDLDYGSFQIHPGSSKKGRETKRQMDNDEQYKKSRLKDLYEIYKNNDDSDKVSDLF